mmetsp:Transcript_57616/g.125323  ORF Transcript_57616/g.125323 Transcript_57616/m.125323 type:complete len:265 (-) Transcript_57616:193-987(-)
MASNGSNAARVAAARQADVDMHQDIARDIGQQVEIMILEAKRASESKVGQEIQRVKARMEAISEKIKLVTERTARLDSGSQGLLKSDLQKSIAKLEEAWEGEVGTLKHELWQTIQAHNHNADLLKHHKDAIDQVQSRMTDSAPNPELEQVHAQLMQVDKVMQREVEKERHMDALMHRLTSVQHQLSAGLGSWGAAGMGPQFPRMGPQGPGAAVGMAGAAAANAGKKRQQKAPKAKAVKPTAASLAAAASLRAEAPEFVPTQWDG